ncbi:MAG: type I-C CRISPR-associated endonuclease Cas1c [Scytolyngbya sp. HA4215-MV1]|jgi:CRISPR-associated protein Cas1|nr:type I-C CRISPR-associated endonuclease Cas1c [Scytolyngbya sp. HA4215-MV1]
MKQILNTLYVQTQGTYLRLDHDTLKLEVERETKFQIPLHHLGGIVAFGNVLVSPFLIHRCAEDGRSFVWLSEYGKFQARLAGATTGNVLLRRSQHEALSRADATLLIARYIVAGKLQNARNILMRAAREADTEDDRNALSQAAKIHAESIRSTETAPNLDKLRGIEGYAAKSYFAAFTHMIRTNRAAFALTERSRRPPRDPINALLSFVYTLLVGECIAACESVGLDPQMGFLHALRPGRPALALDLMEELRAPLADRLVLTLINRNQIQPDDFVERPGGAIYLKDEARKTLLTAYQKRKQEEITHLIAESKAPLGLVCHIQARLLARHLRGDVPSYQPFIQR